MGVDTRFAVVTGAFSYTGRFIAARLLDEGFRVRTLSRTPAPAGSPIDAVPFSFDDQGRLRRDLSGADVLYNTYWIRFAHGGTTFDDAVANTLTLWRAARAVGVRRIVHVSVTQADESSPLPYFRAKARLERLLREAGGSWAVIRPTWIFGPEDILVNNIAWGLRKLPVFPIAGDGSYRVQPVSADDTARICVDLGRSGDNTIVDAAGPETLRFREVVEIIRSAIERRTPVVTVPPRLALSLAHAVGRARHDVLLTKDEIDGLRADLLTSAEPPRGQDSFRSWVEAHADELGRRYVSELDRNFRHPTDANR